MRSRFVQLISGLSLLGLMLAAGAATQPASLCDMIISDIAMHLHRLPDQRSKATVLLFAGVECPVSNSYVPEINRLVKAYTDRGVSFYMIYSGTDVTKPAVVKHAKEFVVACPAVVDADCQIADAAGATMTLEVVVAVPLGSIVYRGRLDDQYASLGKKRFAATTHDLQDVLDDVLVGKNVEPTFTHAVGCAIVKPEAKKP